MRGVATDLAYASKYLCKALQANVDLILDYKVPGDVDPGRFRIKAIWLQRGKTVSEVTSIDASKAASIDFQTILQQHHHACVQRFKLVEAAAKKGDKKPETKGK